jgi:hypothetical protein
VQLAERRVFGEERDLDRESTAGSNPSRHRNFFPPLAARLEHGNRDGTLQRPADEAESRRDIGW